VGKDLLPRKFTMPGLQRLYEAVLGKTLTAEISKRRCGYKKRKLHLSAAFAFLIFMIFIPTACLQG
jgi:hypothetical protein